MKENTAENSIPLHVNLTSYDNVEMLENFDQSKIENYCLDKLKACSKHISFIKNNIVFDEQWRGKICEIGSGNSRLLYRLEQENILKHGLGIEISQSRHRFAEVFKKFANSHAVTNLNSNIFDVKPPENCDLLLGVDIALQLMTPVAPNAERDLFAWMRKAIRPGGYLILEMWDLSFILRQMELASGCLQYWKEFPKSDPFEFILMQVQSNNEHDLVWKKTFIKRNSMERSHFENVIRPYNQQRIINLLQMNGFNKIEKHDYWQTPGDVNDEGEYIILAKKES